MTNETQTDLVSEFYSYIKQEKDQVKKRSIIESLFAQQFLDISKLNPGMFNALEGDSPEVLKDKEFNMALYYEYEESKSITEDDSSLPQSAKKTRMAKKNKDYEAITMAGYGINITTLHGGKGYIYLTKNGLRVPNSRISIYTNNRTASAMEQLAPTARSHTHLGNALAELRMKNQLA